MTDHVHPPAPGDTLVFENDRVRVWAMTLAPGGMFDFHQHHHDHLILWPDAGRAEAQELGDPEWSLSLDVTPGFAMFKTVGRSGPLRPHRIRNLEDRSVTHYIVELISEPSPSPAELPGVTNDRGQLTDRRGQERRD
ncbi:hypothetical protein [Amycolatopsis anabasis]|uniref:hypothetical protein n=1 Tax=Amycolatopsis anabasis TaxID=1840409 RepID=UPI00131AC64F|nr:hypothetical protein [Amycolatopsis anabasis]